MLLLIKIQILIFLKLLSNSHSFKALLHYALGLRVGNLKSSKTHEKTQLTRVFT